MMAIPSRAAVWDVTRTGSSSLGNVSRDASNVHWDRSNLQWTRLGQAWVAGIDAGWEGNYDVSKGRGNFLRVDSRERIEIGSRPLMSK